MQPQVESNQGLHGVVSLFATILKKNGFRGDFQLDVPTRLVNATDNSIYEVMPLAVAMPFDGNDVAIMLQLANKEPFKQIYFCARGGGTGTNGQSLTNGVVIDFSRYMTRVIEFDPVAQTIVVEPGVILSDLNRMLAKHGLFFAPNVSTADRATIGGMIATDAAGKGSLIYGKTADHLLGLQVYVADGQLIDTLTANESLPYRDEVIELLEPIQEEINQQFPPLKRPLSGYNIKQCYENKQFSLERLIAGSEGTLGLVTAAKLNLLPIPKFKTLMVVHYHSFVEALRDAQFLIKFLPLAIEAVDEKVQQSAQTLPNWAQLAKILQSENQSYISNFVEFVADSQEELETKISQVEAALIKRGSKFVTVRDNGQINQLWSIRSLAVGLVAKLPGTRKPIAFVEDAIVPPENLADFVADLQTKLDEQNFTYAMYGHVDVGCIHVRPALDMQNPNDRAHIRPITEQVIALLDKYNGILWGEHGKGYRGEFVPHVFGPKLYNVLCQIKALFDPQNRLNPGKLTAPSPDIKLQRIELVAMRGELDEKVAASDQEYFAPAMLCNGNGACFNQDPSNVMCPSYKVTKSRLHSPKGRAMLVKEWLRAKNNRDEIAEKQRAEDAFSALAGCLGCKACVGKCPTQVSIPEIRSKFLDAYYAKYKSRRLRDIVLGRVEKLLPLAAKVPSVWNTVAKYDLMDKFGLTNLPVIPRGESLHSYLKRKQIMYYDGNVNTLPNNSIVIFTDVFTGFLDNRVVVALIEVIRKLDLIPYVIAPQDSGKGLIWGGFISEFKANSQKLIQLTEPLFKNNIPVVGLENTITTLFKDEIPKFAGHLSGKMISIADLLAGNLGVLAQWKLEPITVKYRLLPHCTEQALLPSDGINWQKIFSTLGVNLEVKNLGCCGMAGTYGHLSENIDNSAKLFKTNWQETISDASRINLASGFSCRSQTSKLAEVQLLHPIEIINSLMTVRN